MGYKELEAQVLALPPEEKARLVQVLVPSITHAWPGIEKTPGVSGGDACIVRTRIPVWLLEGYRRLSLTDVQILNSYPSLTASDLAHAWAYVAANPGVIDNAIRQNDEA